MPDFECLVTLNDSLLLLEADPSNAGRLQPLRGHVVKGESPLEACAREVRRQAGFRVSPSCAGVIYGSEDREHGYTLVFIADAPADAVPAAATLSWVEIAGFRHREDVPALQRELIPLFLTADTPLAVLLDGEGDEAVGVKESAPIPHARLSPLVFAVAS